MVSTAADSKTLISIFVKIYYEFTKYLFFVTVLTKKEKEKILNGLHLFVDPLGSAAVGLG